MRGFEEHGSWKRKAGNRSDQLNPHGTGRTFCKWGLMSVLEGGVGDGVVKPVGNSSLHCCGKGPMSSAPAICLL